MKCLIITVRMIPAPDNNEEVGRLLSMAGMDIRRLKELPTVMALRDDHGRLAGAVTFMTTDVEP